MFTSQTGTSFHKIQKPDQFKAYKALMLDNYIPLRKMASKVGISIQTAFDWRHKILSGPSDGMDRFESITDMDNSWFLYRQKGRKGKK